MFFGKLKVGQNRACFDENSELTAWKTLNIALVQAFNPFTAEKYWTPPNCMRHRPPWASDCSDQYVLVFLGWLLLLVVDWTKGFRNGMYVHCFCQTACKFIPFGPAYRPQADLAPPLNGHGPAIFRNWYAVAGWHLEKLGNAAWMGWPTSDLRKFSVVELLVRGRLLAAGAQSETCRVHTHLVY